LLKPEEVAVRILNNKLLYGFRLSVHRIRFCFKLEKNRQAVLLNPVIQAINVGALYLQINAPAKRELQGGG